MRLFEIWSEGYRATGESGVATLHGTGQGETFLEACDNYARLHPTFAEYYRSGAHPSYWACRLYDNESDARKAFG